MNKFVVLIIALGALVASGILYKAVFSKGETVLTGEVKDITITIPKNSWTFEPEEVQVNMGDRVRLTFINQDDYDHGVGIDAYGVSQRIPARAKLQVPEFTATKAGNFQFYCSVSCGEGIVENGKYQGQKRTHFDQIGRIIVIDPKAQVTAEVPSATTTP